MLSAKPRVCGVSGAMGRGRREAQREGGWRVEGEVGRPLNSSGELIITKMAECGEVLRAV